MISLHFAFVNKIRRLERLEDYPSFTVASISPDFSPVFELTKKYFVNGFVLCLDVELEILG
jgi:hypothetical protein